MKKSISQLVTFGYIVPIVALIFLMLPVDNAHSQNKNPALIPIDNVPGKPRVLIIGDSISIGYTIPVRNLIGDVANIHRPPENCGSTLRGLSKLDSWLGEKEWDVIIFNWGLHDLKYVDNNGRKVPSDKGTQFVPVETYGENLETLIQRLKKTGALLIWVSTTPVPEGCDRVHGDAKRYNAEAETIMKKHGIAINDLYTFALERLDRIQGPENVHFNEEGSDELAGQMSLSILKALVKTYQ